MTGPAVAAVPRIDAHLHLWDLGDDRPGWLDPSHGPLWSTVDAPRADAALAAAGIDAAVLVQADDTDADTDRMLAAARSHPRFVGVVGWVPLEDPDRAERRLERIGGMLCGVRALLHEDPRRGLLALPAVRATLRRVAERGLALDVPDAHGPLLAEVPALADALPELTVVVDHLGKPPADPSALGHWHDQLAAVAARPGTVAKLSGLQHLPATSLPRVLDSALELFGPARLLWGSDWPMTLGDGGLGATLARTLPLLDALTTGERAAVLGGTARRVYRLDPTRTADLDEEDPSCSPGSTRS